VLWDAAILPGGEEAVAELSVSGQALEFIKDQYRHCKPILVLGAANDLLEAVSIPTLTPSGEPDPGLLLQSVDDPTDEVLARFVQAVARHRHFERQTDPPLI
jgi:catalase